MHHALDYIWSLSESKRMHILTFWWLRWSNRNKLREGELPESADAVARRTTANVMQYEQIYSLPKAGQTPQRLLPLMSHKRMGSQQFLWVEYSTQIY